MDETGLLPSDLADFRYWWRADVGDVWAFIERIAAEAADELIDRLRAELDAE